MVPAPSAWSQEIPTSLWSEESAFPHMVYQPILMAVHSSHSRPKAAGLAWKP